MIFYYIVSKLILIYSTIFLHALPAVAGRCKAYKSTENPNTDKRG